MRFSTIIGTAVGIRLTAAAASSGPPSLTGCNNKDLSCSSAGTISKADVNNDRDKTDFGSYHHCASFGGPCGNGPANSCKHYNDGGIDLVWYTNDKGTLALCRASKDNVDCGCSSN